MKKDLGPLLALYPMPATVVGAESNGKVNWLMVAHVGIIGHDRLMVSMHKAHHTNQMVKDSRRLSINMVDKGMLRRADYVGCVSGAKTDKQGVFAHHTGPGGTPVIDESPLVMECEVTGDYETDTFDNFICRVTHTIADENVTDDMGKPDYNRLKPVLFDMPGYSYLRTGDVICRCTLPGREYARETDGDN